MYWNHRVIFTPAAGINDDIYGIHEVYYFEDGTKGYSENPAEVSAESEEGLVEYLSWMVSALKKPILHSDNDFKNPVNNIATVGDPLDQPTIPLEELLVWFESVSNKDLEADV